VRIDSKLSSNNSISDIIFAMSAPLKPKDMEISQESNTFKSYDLLPVAATILPCSYNNLTKNFV